jgi:raffinose/stachyose/melibiose transport system permease protein
VEGRLSDGPSQARPQTVATTNLTPSQHVNRRVEGVPGVAPWPVILAFLLPALALYGVFVVYPIAQSVRYSGFDWNGLQPLTDWVGFGNFADAFADPVFIQAITHNAIIIGLSLLFQIPFAVALAVLLSRKLKGRGLFRTMFFAPYILSEVVTGVVWRQILRPDGLLDQILAGVGAGGITREWLGDPDIVLYSLFFVISWKYFGLHMVLVLAGLQLIPDELEEAASIDGATWWQGFRYVTLPLLGPTIRVSMFLSIIGALQLFDLIWVTTKGGPVNASSTMATYLIDWGFRRGQFGYASAVSVIVFGLSLVVALLYQRFVLRRDLKGALTG